MKLLYECSRE